MIWIKILFKHRFLVLNNVFCAGLWKMSYKMFRKYISYYWLDKKEGLHIVETVNKSGEYVRFKFSENEFNWWKKDLSKFPIPEQKRFDELGVVHKSKNAPLFERNSKTKIDKYQIEITEVCNLKCEHCYLGKTKRKKTMSYDSFCKIVENGIRKGLKIVELTGGEPTLHPDFDKIVKYTKSKGLYLSLITNGTVKINPKSFDLIQVSIDGIKETHEKIRGVNGIFSKITENVNYYKKYTSVVIATVLLPSTSLWEVFQLHKMFSLPIRVGPPVPTGNANGLSPKEMMELYRRSFAFYDQMGLDVRHKFSCDAGNIFFYYDVESDVSPCPLLRGVSLEEWKKHLQKYESVCNNCFGCLYPCPAYRFYSNKIVNPWCKKDNFSLFDSEYDDIIFAYRPIPENDYVEGVHNFISEFNPNAKSILSIGCGYAGIEEKLMKSHGYKVTGINKASKPYKLRGDIFKSEGLKYIVGDAFDKKAYPNDKFDVVMLLWSSVIGYDRGQKDESLLKNISDATKKGSIVIIDTNNGGLIFKKIYVLKNTVKYKKYTIKMVDLDEPPLSYTFFDIYKKNTLLYSDMWALKLYSKKELVDLAKKYSLKLVGDFSSIKGIKNKGTRMVLIFERV